MIYYNVKNLATGKIVVMTKAAKELLFNAPANSKKYELIEECDQNGRAFDYNNFLTKTNESKSIGIGTTEEKEIKGSGSVESKSIEGNDANSGIGTNGTSENNGNESKSEDNSNTKQKRIKPGKGK